MAPRNILSLSSEEKRIFLDSFDYIFSDIDGESNSLNISNQKMLPTITYFILFLGVVWNLTHTVEGAPEGFNELRKVGKQLTFITNNSVRPEEMCIEKLRKNNIDIEAVCIIFESLSLTVNTKMK